MRGFVCTLGMLLFGGLTASAVVEPPGGDPKSERGLEKYRYKGMKAAVTDLEAGELQMKISPT